MHPHRVFTKGRQVASGTDISIGEATFASSGWSQGGSGWGYGINAAALIGATDNAMGQVLGRAHTSNAAGYRFPAFAPHEQDASTEHEPNPTTTLPPLTLTSEPSSPTPLDSSTPAPIITRT